MTLTKELLDDLAMRQRKGWHIRRDEFEFLLEVARQTLERLESAKSIPSVIDPATHTSPYPWNTRTP